MANNAYINRVDYGGSTLIDLTSDTAIASDVASGKTFHLATGEQVTGTATGGNAIVTGQYTSNTKTLEILAQDVTATWFGAVGYEFLYEARCTLYPKNASNWPITPTTTAQNLTWTTTYTATAGANAVFDRYGKDYHNGTALDYGQYSYVWLEDAFTQIVYDVDEATMGAAHVISSAFESVMHYAARPRVASGAIVYPTATTYGTYGNTSSVTNMCYYRTDANVIALANNCTYGVGITLIAPQQASTSSVKPNYVNFRYPTISIRANDTYMPISSFDRVDWDKTKVEARYRLYRVPTEYGLYNMQNDRIVRSMILGKTFPVELQ